MTTEIQIQVLMLTQQEFCPAESYPWPPGQLYSQDWGSKLQPSYLHWLFLVQLTFSLFFSVKVTVCGVKTSAPVCLMTRLLLGKLAREWEAPIRSWPLSWLVFVNLRQIRVTYKAQLKSCPRHTCSMSVRHFLINDWSQREHSTEGYASSGQVDRWS